MGSSAGHESSRQCKTIKTEQRINELAGFGHDIVESCSPDGPGDAPEPRRAQAASLGNQSTAQRDQPI